MVNALSKFIDIIPIRDAKTIFVITEVKTKSLHNEAVMEGRWALDFEL